MSMFTFGQILAFQNPTDQVDVDLVTECSISLVQACRNVAP